MRNVGWSLIFFQLNTYIDLQTQEVDDDIDIDIDIDQDSRHRHFYPILSYSILVKTTTVHSPHFIIIIIIIFISIIVFVPYGKQVQYSTGQDKTGSLAVSSTPLTNY